MPASGAESNALFHVIFHTLNIEFSPIFLHRTGFNLKKQNMNRKYNMNIKKKQKQSYQFSNCSIMPIKWCEIENRTSRRALNTFQFEVISVYLHSARTHTGKLMCTHGCEACALPLCTLWFGEWANPVARASSIDTGRAPFSGRASARPTQTRLHAGWVSAMDGWTAAQTWRTQTEREKEEVQDKHIVLHAFSCLNTQ